MTENVNKDWANGIGIIFKKCSAPKSSLAFWVRVPEFVEEIKKALDASISINDEYVLNVMKKIYQKKQEDRNLGTDTGFNFHLSRQSLKILSENIAGDRDFWER